MQVHERPTVDTLQAAGTQIIDTAKNLIHEGNIRKISIKQGGAAVAEFPLTFGVLGVVIAPALAAIGVVVALANDCTIEVKRTAAPQAPEVSEH
jgi:Domain of unknown function (DUF4342)